MEVKEEFMTTKPSASLVSPDKKSGDNPSGPTLEFDPDIQPYADYEFTEALSDPDSPYWDLSKN